MPELFANNVLLTDWDPQEKGSREVLGHYGLYRSYSRDKIRYD